MLLTSFSGKNQTVFFQAPNFFTKSISYGYDVMLHAMTFILSDNEEVFCIAQQLKRMLKLEYFLWDSRSMGT